MVWVDAPGAEQKQKKQRKDAEGTEKSREEPEKFRSSTKEKER